MKESKLIEMKNKIETLGKVVQFLLEENKRLKELGVGTLEAVKLMPGYDEAIEKLKIKISDEEEKKVEV